MTDQEFLRDVAEKLRHVPINVMQMDDGHISRLERLSDKLSDIKDQSFCSGCGELTPDDELNEDNNCEPCAEDAKDWETAPGGSRGGSWTDP